MFEFIRDYFLRGVNSNLKSVRSAVLSFGSESSKIEADLNQKIVNLGNRIKVLSNKLNKTLKENNKVLRKIESNAKEIATLKKALSEQVEVAVK